mgnify:CR=1 FL=1
MASTIDAYRAALRNLEEWDGYLLQHSNLPGPRGNLELAQAAALEGQEAQFLRWLKFDAIQAPVNSPAEFLPFCGVLGLGRLVVEGHTEHVKTIRPFAADARWRVREAVAMALQAWGRGDMSALLREMAEWSRGNLLERRAAAAALCEPALLRRESDVRRVLEILDDITASIQAVGDRRTEDFKVLRQGLGYCWSVAVVACPQMGKSLMEKWFASEDKDIRWIMKENLRKKRLERMDESWVAEWSGRLAQQ